MSSINERNAEIMIAETKRQQAAVSELRLMVVEQNAKIATLSGEIAQLKQQAIMRAVSERVSATGHGGTA